MRVELTQKRLRELLRYEPESGNFYVVKTRGGVKAGAVAGSTNNSGYWRLKIDDRAYLAHRVAWFWMTGVWPSAQIDHRNLDKLDNRWENLRDVPQEINRQNAISAQSNSRSGVLGVSQCRGKWRAFIGVEKKVRYLGSFETIQEAGEAYLRAKDIFHVGAR